MTTRREQILRDIRALEAGVQPRRPTAKWPVVDSPGAFDALRASGYCGPVILDPIYAMPPAQRRIEQQIRKLEGN